MMYRSMSNIKCAAIVAGTAHTAANDAKQWQLHPESSVPIGILMQHHAVIELGQLGPVLIDEEQLGVCHLHVVRHDDDGWRMNDMPHE